VRRTVQVAATLVALVLGCVGSAPGGAGAAELTVDAADLLTPDELTDLRLMAEEDGIPLQEAIDAYGWQNSFALLATAVEERWPDEFAGARIVDAAGQRAAISFRGAVPQGAREMIAGFGGARVDLAEERGFSTRQLDERLQAVHRAVTARDDLVRAAVSTYDDRTGAISVAVTPVDPATATDPRRERALVDALLAGLPAAAQHWPVTVVVQPRVPGEGEGPD
jgi:hypothetical protein